MSWLSQHSFTITARVWSWLDQHLQAILIGGFTVLQGVWAIAIGLSIGFGGTVFVFFFTSVLVSIMIIRAGMPMIRVLDEKLKTATSASGKWLSASGFVGITVFMVWMVCAGGTISALLSGMSCSYLPCSVFMSFGWMHVIVGVGATVLPLLIAGCCVLAGSLKRSCTARPYMVDHDSCTGDS